MAAPDEGEMRTSVSWLPLLALSTLGCGTTATTTCSEVTGARPSICCTARSPCGPGAGCLSTGAGAAVGGGVVATDAVEGLDAAGWTASIAAWSFIFTRQAYPRAAAMITAPTATSAITERDMKLPLVRRPTAFGVAP